MLADLHCHSTHSDGILSPSDLVSRACERGVTVLALTDHDTLSGVEEARLAARDAGMTLISGVEFSSQWAGRGIHIVGLGIDPQSAAMREAVEAQQAAREQRNGVIAQKLEQKLGMIEVLPKARKVAGFGQLGRPHFAQLLVAEGKVSTTANAFKKFLGTGKIGDVRQQWPGLEAIVEAIHAAGGQAVLAHPAKYKLTRTKLRSLIGDFAECGGDAIELVSGRQPPGTASDLLRLAEAFDLRASCGSDFHRPDSPWQELGAFEPLPPGARPVWEEWACARH